MKRLLLLLALCLSIININAQDRINSKPFEFHYSGPKIINIDSWQYNESEGEWDRENHVNFIQMKLFDYYGTSNYVLLISAPGGHYRYPNIRQDFISYPELTAFLLTKEQYNKIINVSEQRYNIELSKNVTYNKYYHNVSDNSIIRNLKGLSHNLSNAYRHTLSIEKYKDVIRFVIGYDKSPLFHYYHEVSIKEWEKLKVPE